MNTKQLRLTLDMHGIDYHAWGTTKGSKPLRRLLEELLSGETLLEETSSGLRRIIRVSSVDVFTQIGNVAHRLVEVEQRFHYGRIRKREELSSSISEKLLPGEMPEEAARRGLAEEVQLRNPAIPLTYLGEQIVEQDSPSYPGLRTEYRLSNFRIELSVEQAALLQLDEMQEDKMSVFEWRTL